MTTVAEVQKLALELPEKDRARLASELLESLPEFLADDDGGIAEALRRGDELEADPSIGLSMEQLDHIFRSRNS